MDEQVEHNIPYFRNLFQTNITNLQNQCKIWEEICLNNSVPDEVLGDIRTNIGLTNLLMNQKLKQFKGLIDDCEFNTGEREITCLDLQGFWDMVYNEVTKINKCFTRLEKCKNNEWKFEDENSENMPKRKVHVKKAFSARDDSSESRALAAKQRLAEVKKRMLVLREQQKQKNSDDNGKFFNTTEAAVIAQTKEATEDFEQDVFVNGKEVPSVKTSGQIETNRLSKESKYKANLQKIHTPSIENKENFVSDDGSDAEKSKAHTKSKKKSEVSSAKKGKKDYGTLQCVTRSAKKALLAQQNMIQKS